MSSGDGQQQKQPQYGGSEPSEGATPSGSSQNPSQSQSNVVNKPDQTASRHKNLQRIQQKKQAVINYPYNDKLLKLASYSKCQVGCEGECLWDVINGSDI